MSESAFPFSRSDILSVRDFELRLHAHVTAVEREVGARSLSGTCRAHDAPPGADFSSADVKPYRYSPRTWLEILRRSLWMGPGNLEFGPVLVACFVLSPACIFEVVSLIRFAESTRLAHCTVETSDGEGTHPMPSGLFKLALIEDNPD